MSELPGLGTFCYEDSILISRLRSEVEGWKRAFDQVVDAKKLAVAEVETPKAEIERLRVHHADDEPSWRHRAEALEAKTEHERVALRAEVEGLKSALADAASRLRAGTLHLVECSADHNKPTGGDMCICNPLKAKLADAEDWKRTALQGREELARIQVERNVAEAKLAEADEYRKVAEGDKEMAARHYQAKLAEAEREIGRLKELAHQIVARADEAERVAEGYLKNATPTDCGACAEIVCCGSATVQHVGCAEAKLLALEGLVGEVSAARLPSWYPTFTAGYETAVNVLSRRLAAILKGDPK